MQKKKFFISIICLLYFIVCIPFYSNEYYVPDYRLYTSFVEAGYAAKDGFSSLFLLLTGISNYNPHIYHIAILVLITVSLYFLLNSIESSDNKILISVYASILSFGYWYYLYGKLHYDFPYTLINAIACWVILNNFIKQNKFNAKDSKAFFILLGLLLSWKPYNLFAVAVFLVISVDKIGLLNSLLFYLKGLHLQFIGYIIGNFNLLLHLKKTIKGILAYPAQYNLSDFFFQKSRIIWDHINDSPFNISVINIVTLVFLLLIFPILLKKINIIIFNIAITGFFLIFIKKFSPGYAWHGFTFGLYVTFITIYLSRFITAKILKYFLLALVPQIIINFFYYIPSQYSWNSYTKSDIQEIKNNSNSILKDIKEDSDKYNRKFSVITNIQRLFVTRNSENITTYPNRKNSYLFPCNIAFQDAFQYFSGDLYNELTDSNLYTTDYANADVVYQINPKSNFYLKNILSENPFNMKCQKTEYIYRQDYSIKICNLIRTN